MCRASRGAECWNCAFRSRGSGGWLFHGLARRAWLGVRWSTERAEGDYEEVIFDNSTHAELLPGPLPELASAQPRPSTVLRTWDTSFVPEPARRGLYRIHLREGASGGLEERFEYVVTGAAAEVDAWLEQVDDARCSAELVEVRTQNQQSTR